MTDCGMAKDAKVPQLPMEIIAEIGVHAGGWKIGSEEMYVSLFCSLKCTTSMRTASLAKIRVNRYGWLDAFQKAVDNSFDDVCKFLISDEFQFDGEMAINAMILAIHEMESPQNYDFCRQMLESNVVTGDFRESEALIAAAEEGDTSLCALFLQYGARPNAQKSVALIIAAQKGHDKVCVQLLTARDEPALADSLNSEALYQAVANSHLNVCRVLLSPVYAGSHTAIVTSRNSRVFEVALRDGYHQICMLLLNYVSDFDTWKADMNNALHHKRIEWSDICGFKEYLCNFHPR